MPGQTVGVEDRALGEPRAAALAGLHGELQPREAGHLHLGSQAKQAWGNALLDAPEVDGVADDEVIGVAPPAAQAHAPDQAVEEATDLPEEGRGVVAVLATDAFDGVPEGLGAGRGVHHPHIGVERPARPLGIRGQGIARRTRCRGVRPARGDVGVANASEGVLDGCVEGQETLGGIGDVARDVVFLAHRGVLEGLDERARESPGDGRDEADPVAGQSG